jgi:hypothetical protein
VRDPVSEIFNFFKPNKKNLIMKKYRLKIGHGAGVTVEVNRKMFAPLRA